MHVFLQNICIYEKNALSLHPLLRNKRVSLFSREAVKVSQDITAKPEGIKI